MTAISFEQTFKKIDRVLGREAGCSSGLDYTEQISWMLFLKYLDDLEAEKAMEAEIRGKSYQYIIDKPLKAHTLMQAIARANRVHAGKNNGLIVDYCGG